MPEKLTSFEFKRADARHGRGKWGEWLDGSIWKFVHGVDFHTTCKEMTQDCSKAWRNTAYQAGIRLGVHVRTSAENDYVVVQAFRGSNALAENRAEDHGWTGEQIEGERKRLGLSRLSLASLSGVSVQTIYNIEKGKARGHHPNTIPKIIKAITALREASGIEA